MKNTKEDIAKAFGQHAQLYVDKYFNVDYYEDALNLCYKHSNGEGIFLDIACGPGNLTSHLLAHFPNATILGIDSAEEMLTLAIKLNPKARFKNISCTELLSIEQTFDGILCGFVLPYLNKSETKKLIRDASELLNVNGTLFLSGNLGNYKNSTAPGSSSGKGPKLYSFDYSLSFLAGELKKNGFNILSTFDYHREYEGFSAKEFAIVAIKA